MIQPARKAAFWGLLAALAVTLSFLESLLPALPFLPPGAKAGFSNIVTMFAASYLGLAPALAVAVFKSFFVLLTRGGTAFAMSLAGGVTATVVSYFCIKKRASLLVTGIMGALTHNTAQLLTAVCLTGTPYLFAYYPLLVIFAVAAGAVTGLLLKVTYPPLSKAAQRILP